MNEKSPLYFATPPQLYLVISGYLILNKVTF